MSGHDGYTRYTLRIPDALYERVKSAAGEKSVNAEIVATLEKFYPDIDHIDDRPEQDRMKFNYILQEMKKLLDEYSED
ncbi:hypothetical protein [Celeribacter sp. SCSIO 80788]|uniref:hypothetical protein n=1 Tax=Celeribacter sp. SCSIO 80788 TaxID=3117013 RepID=UPI003DA1D86F